MATYHAEADHLLKSYNRAVGHCLEHGIKVYGEKGRELALGELRDALRAVGVTHV